MGRRVFFSGTDHDIQNHAQMTYEASRQYVAGTARLVRVITYVGSAQLAEQRLDGGVDVQYPQHLQSRIDASQKLRAKPSLHPAES
jgi:hypothetical protein